MKPSRILKNNGIGIVPTDTLYGIVGSAFSKKAVERIYTVKGRTATKPFIILISSLGDIKDFSIALSAEQKKFLNSVWPGKVSVIIPCPIKKFEYLHRGTQSLAFRLPRKKTLIGLLKKTGPLVAPSANREGEAPAQNVSEAKKYFSDAVDFYSAGGTKKGKPSKIVSLVSGIPEVVRK